MFANNWMCLIDSKYPIRWYTPLFFRKVTLISSFMKNFSLFVSLFILKKFILNHSQSTMKSISNSISKKYLSVSTTEIWSLVLTTSRQPIMYLQKMRNHPLSFLMYLIIPILWGWWVCWIIKCFQSICMISYLYILILLVINLSNVLEVIHIMCHLGWIYYLSGWIVKSCFSMHGCGWTVAWR